MLKDLLRRDGKTQPRHGVDRFFSPLQGDGLFVHAGETVKEKDAHEVDDKEPSC